MSPKSDENCHSKDEEWEDTNAVEKAIQRQSRDWNYAAKKQGMPRATKMPGSILPETLEGAWPWGHLNFGLLAPELSENKLLLSSSLW